MKAEELPTRRSYQMRFRESVRLLMAAAETRCSGLHGVDVCGAFFAAGVELARQTLPDDYSVADLLRNIASVLDEKKEREQKPCDPAIN